MPIKVAIVEDDARVCESLAILINGARDFSCVGSFPNAETALKNISRNWPDVLLMDINLPGMSGIECAARLKEQRPSLQIIMLTSYEDDERIFDSLKSGASGYLLKRATPAEILEAVVDAKNNGAPMSSSIARTVVDYFYQQRKIQNETDDLSKREIEILSLLSKGYQYKEIGDQLSISALTVRSHLHRIYSKLHVRSRTEAVVKFLGRR